jgi:hypothetical protein
MEEYPVEIISLTLLYLDDTSLFNIRILSKYLYECFIYVYNIKIKLLTISSDNHIIPLYLRKNYTSLRDTKNLSIFNIDFIPINIYINNVDIGVNLHKFVKSHVKSIIISNCKVNLTTFQLKTDINLSFIKCDIIYNGSSNPEINFRRK